MRNKRRRPYDCSQMSKTVPTYKTLALHVTALQLCEHPVLFSNPPLNGLPNCCWIIPESDPRTYGLTSWAHTAVSTRSDRCHDNKILSQYRNVCNCVWEIYSLEEEGHDLIKENQHPHYHKYVLTVRSELQDSTGHNHVTISAGLITRIVLRFSLWVTMFTVLVFHRLRY